MKKLAVSLLIGVSLLAQSEPKKLTFEVVSIKPNNSGASQIMSLMMPDAHRFTASNASLRLLIESAYTPGSAGPLSTTEITGLPGWANTARYDVEARWDAGFTPTSQQRDEMLQEMLSDRFKLKIRRQPKDIPIYALVVDKGGVKMQLSADQTPKAVNLSAGPPSPPAGNACIVRFGLGRIGACGQPTSWLVMLLTSQAGRKIVDKTGLTGFYDWDLKWTPVQGFGGAPLPPGTEVDPSGPSLFTALQEQLGLRLVSETGQVDTFVVESVERPTEN